MILLIDNYDSFTYNLVQRLGEHDPNLDLVVRRNDAITVEEIVSLAPRRMVPPILFLSPSGMNTTQSS